MGNIVQFTFPSIPSDDLRMIRLGKKTEQEVRSGKQNIITLKNVIKSIPKSMPLKRILISSSFINSVGDYLMANFSLKFSTNKKFFTIEEKIKRIEGYIITNGLRMRFENNRMKIECDDLRCKDNSEKNPILDGNIIIEAVPLSVMFVNNTKFSIPDELPESAINGAVYRATNGSVDGDVFTEDEEKAMDKMTSDGRKEYFVSRISKNIKEAEKKYKKELMNDKKQGLKFLTREEFAKHFNVKEDK